MVHKIDGTQGAPVLVQPVLDKLMRWCHPSPYLCKLASSYAAILDDSHLIQSGDDTTELHEEEYSNHKYQLDESRPPEARIVGLETALLSAFDRVVEIREIPVIAFGDLSVDELTMAFHWYPIIIKPILTSVNVAHVP